MTNADIGFEVGQWYTAFVVNYDCPEEYENGCGYEVNVKIVSRNGDYVTVDDEYGETYRRKVKTTRFLTGPHDNKVVETFDIKSLDKARFYATHFCC